MTNRRSTWRLVGAVGCAVIASAGCGGFKSVVRPDFMDRPPRRVAVLPFVITYAYDLQAGAPIPESHQVGRDLLRKAFYDLFTTYGYEDVPLDVVDASLAQALGSNWQQATPQVLGQAVGADAVVFGEIQRAVFIATPAYTDATIDATFRMVDAASGATLWSRRVNVAERGGAAVQKGQVVDFIQDQMVSYRPEVKFRLVADAVVRQALEKLPDPSLPVEPLTAMGGRLRVAVLPLAVPQKGDRKGAASLRRYLAASLQESPFAVVELARVNAYLQQRQPGWSEGDPLPAGLLLQALGQALGADVVLRGAVTDWGRNYWVVESWVRVGLKVELVDVANGDVIWSKRNANSHTAGILKGPTGFKSLVTAPLSGLKKSHLERVGLHLTRDLVDDMVASPKVTQYLRNRQPSVALSAPASPEQTPVEAN